MIFQFLPAKAGLRQVEVLVVVGGGGVVVVGVVGMVKEIEKVAFRVIFGASVIKQKF